MHTSILVLDINSGYDVSMEHDSNSISVSDSQGSSLAQAPTRRIFEGLKVLGNSQNLVHASEVEKKYVLWVVH